MFLKDHARKYDSMVYSVKNFKKVNDYFVIYESDFIFQSDQGMVIKQFEMKVRLG